MLTYLKATVYIPLDLISGGRVASDGIDDLEQLGVRGRSLQVLTFANALGEILVDMSPEEFSAAAAAAYKAAQEP